MRAVRAIAAAGLVAAGPAGAQAPAQPLTAPSGTQAPVVQPLDAYAEAAATTIIAEQSCPGVRVNAGALTSLRLAARVTAAQEPVLEEKLRTRASQIRQQLAAEGREGWCGDVFAAFGPGGTAAKGVLAR